MPKSRAQWRQGREGLVEAQVEDDDDGEDEEDNHDDEEESRESTVASPVSVHKRYVHVLRTREDGISPLAFTANLAHVRKLSSLRVSPDDEVRTVLLQSSQENSSRGKHRGIRLLRGQ